MTTASSPWRETGDTDLSAFVKAVSRSVQPGASPMASSAAGVYEVLRRYGLTRLGAAMLWHERKNDSWGPAFGLDSTFRNPWAMRCNPQAAACRNGWSVYATYANAAEAWAKRLLDPNGPYARTVTLTDLIAVYAPESDGNNEKGYVQTVVHEIDALPLVQGGAMATNPFPTPVIYDLARDADAARFSLTPDERNRLLKKCIPNRNSKTPRVIVLHIQDGVTAGSLDWWANNAQASSTVLINKDGSVVRCIPEQNGPWTNGLVSSPSATGQRVINQFGPYPNEYSLTIEAEGRPNDAMPDAQLQAICWQVWDWMDRYGISAQNVIRHADIDGATRAHCPGPYYGKVMAAIAGGEYVSGDNWRNRPAWLPADLIKVLFPEAVPGGIRSEAWLRWCRQEGRAPRRVAFHDKDTPQEVIEFSDGLLIFKDGSRSDEKLP